MINMFSGIVLIFLNALGWLNYVLLLLENWKAEWAASIIFIVIVIGFIIFITWERKGGSSGGSSTEEKKE